MVVAGLGRAFRVVVIGEFRSVGEIDGPWAPRLLLDPIIIDYMQGSNQGPANGAAMA